jgi:mannitol/fructose-specific phosphotransferase system IIA component (Ntr-type)
MDLHDVLRPECVAPGLRASSKDEALAGIAELAKRTPVLGAVSREQILEGLQQRERLGTTGFGKGIAIPHCRLEGIAEFVVGVATFPEGVDFDALDGEKVTTVVFIIGPRRQSTEHIRILSLISRALSDEGAIEEILGATSEETLRESFLRHALSERPSGEEVERSLFHVFIGDEDLFHPVLEVFGGTEPRLTVVLDAENAGKYLRKVPLFAGLWADDQRTFTSVIISLVNRRMTNEMIRRVEQIAGPLSDNRSVLLIVQDVFYAAGSVLN